MVLIIALFLLVTIAALVMYALVHLVITNIIVGIATVIFVCSGTVYVLVKSSK